MADPKLTYAQDSLLRQTYLKRLQQKLQYDIAMGVISQSQAEHQLRRVQYNMMALRKPGVFKNTLTPDELTYAQAPETEWQTAVMELEKGVAGKQKQMMANEQYINQLKPYINSLQIPGEQKQQLLTETQRRLAMGLTPKELPEFEGVQTYQKQYQEQVKQIQKQNELVNKELGEAGESERGLGQQLNEAFANRASQENVFQRAQQASLAKLTSNRDWIKRWIIEKGSTRSPWDTAMADVTKLRERVAGLPGAIESMKPTGTGSAYDQYVGTLPGQLEDARTQLAEQEAALPGVSGWQPPRLPRTEPWLRRLVPELAAPGPSSRISKDVMVGAPSGQQWSQTPYSEQEKYLGYLDWVGIPAEDMLQQMERMLPRTSYGAGRTGWATARQGR